MRKKSEKKNCEVNEKKKNTTHTQKHRPKPRPPKKQTDLEKNGIKIREKKMREEMEKKYKLIV